MNWWEDRTISEMPNYVRQLDNSDGRIIKVEWANLPHYPYGLGVRQVGDFMWLDFPAYNYIEATEQEFKDYLKTENEK
jgi:hypothetical protein